MLISFVSKRMAGFGLCIGFGALCFFLAAMMLPVAAIKPGKFASLFTIGSLLAFLSFFFLRGFSTHAQSLLGSDRRLQTGGYFGSLLFSTSLILILMMLDRRLNFDGLALYACLITGSYLLILFSLLLQMLAIAWYVKTFWPGQTTSNGLQFMIRRGAALT